MSNFFDDFISDVQQSAEQSFSNFTSQSVNSLFENTGFVIFGEEKQENQPSSGQGQIQERDIENKDIQKNQPWPMTMRSIKGMSPLLIIGGAVLAALLLRRR